MWVCPECGAAEPNSATCPRDGSQLIDGAQDPLLGSVVGNYRLARVVGKGGMGVVYQGVNPDLASRVAIKVISDEGWRDKAAVERFFAEARAVNLIRHENIVSVLDLGWLSDGRPHIVMEYVDGTALSAVLRRPEGLGGRPLIGIGLEILEALAAAHAQGIVHRDLKPDNVIVTPAGHVKLLDFGIAKLRREGETTHGLTAVGTILGTPLYMSPEQALGQAVDPRSDLYSFGVILYEGLTGRVPFIAHSVFEILRQHVEMRPTPPRVWRPELPEPLEQIVLRALAKNPAERPQSATELAAMLQGIIATLSENWTYPAPLDRAQLAQSARLDSPSVFSVDSLAQSGAMPSGYLSQPSWSSSMQATNPAASLTDPSGRCGPPVRKGPEARHAPAAWVAVGFTGALLVALVTLVVGAAAFVWSQRLRASEPTQNASQASGAVALTSARAEGSIAVSTPVALDGSPPQGSAQTVPRAAPPRTLTPTPTGTSSSPRVATPGLPDGGTARSSDPGRTSSTDAQGQTARQTRSIRLESIPTGANVKLDGKPLGKTPVLAADVAPGYRFFEFDHPDYYPQTLTMEVPVGTKSWVMKFVHLRADGVPRAPTREKQ